MLAPVTLLNVIECNLDDLLVAVIVRKKAISDGLDALRFNRAMPPAGDEPVGIFIKLDVHTAKSGIKQNYVVPFIGAFNNRGAGCAV